MRYEYDVKTKKVTEYEDAAGIPESPQEAVRRQILAIEAESDTPRRRREAVLTDEGKAWLAARDAEIAALRAQL